MSVNVMFAPKNRGRCLDGFTSDEWADFQSLFSSNPTLAQGDIPQLIAFATAVRRHNKRTASAIEQLIDEINKHGAIEMWGEY